MDSRVRSLDVSVFEIPTEEPESDATHEWTSTTIVVVHASAGGWTGMGYTYSYTHFEVQHLELFHDHARLEYAILDGLPPVEGGALRPDLARPGHGLTLKGSDAEAMAA